MRARRSLLAGFRRWVPVLVAMAVLVGFSASSATATGGASVSGRVVDKDGNPLQNVEVGLVGAAEGPWASRTVDTLADGTYTFGGVVPKAYKLRFVEPGYATQWYDDKPRYETAAGFVVGEGETLTSYDATLSRAGTVKGAMTVPPSLDATNSGWVWIDTADGMNGWGVRHAPGSELVGTFEWSLEPGTYFIHYEPDDPRLLKEWYDGKNTRDTATPVTVSADTTIPIEIKLRQGGTVSGRVTDETTGFPGVDVVISDVDGNYQGNSMSTDATGNYKFEGLPPGRYKLRALPPGGSSYVSEYYGDKLSLWQADVVTVAGAETHPDIDFQLEKGAVVQGTVSGGGRGLPLVDVWISGETDDGQEFSVETRTAGDGAYELRGIPKGRHILAFDTQALNVSNIATLTAPTGFVTEFYNDQPTLMTADEIEIAGPGTTRIDATLAVGAAIKGTVRGLTGTVGLGGMRVRALQQQFGEWQQVAGAYSDPDGTYELKGLGAGSYIVLFGDSYGYDDPSARFYRNASTPDDATRLTLTEGQVLTGIDGVSVEYRGRISGRVVGSDGKPAARVKVVFAREKSGTYTETPGDYAYTDYDGQFRGEGVGSVKLRFTDPERRYADAVRPDAVLLEAGRSVAVTQTIPYLGTDSAEGADRFATSVDISRRAFPSGADGLVIATGRNWPDALGGAPLTPLVNGPILLVEKDSIPPVVATEIARLANAWYEGSILRKAAVRPPSLESKIQRVYILGSNEAVSAGVEKQLRDMFDRKDEKPIVVRIAGGDRYETADRIAGEVIAETSGWWDGTAFVSTGLDYPDALAASPLASAHAWPMFLVRPTGVTTATLQSMAAKGVKKVVILGGPAALPKATVEDPLKARFGAANVIRLGGSTRYNTAIEIAKYGVSQGHSWNGLGIATGSNFPDALSGGVLLGKNASVMMLTPPNKLDPGVEAQIRAKKSEISLVRFLGGTSAVSQKVRDQIAAARR